MLDIQLFRTGQQRLHKQQEQSHSQAWSLTLSCCVAEKGGNPDIVRESQKRRYSDVGLVDKVVSLDADWRSGKYQNPNQHLFKASAGHARHPLLK